VNNFSIKEIFQALKLRSRGIDKAFLWGVLAAILVIFVIIVLETVLILIRGIDQEAVSSITEQIAHLSLFSMILYFFQSISGEIFFRGFLLEKIESFAGKNMAIVLTAVLFGLAFISFGELYPSIIPIIMGLILGFIVIKTQNLYSAITAQVFFNIVGFLLFFFSQHFLV
jgi:hypothetical protein